MLASTQNRGYLTWSFWGKTYTVLKFRKSRIQCFKRIAIQSWNMGDMTDWSKTVQRACTYGIEFRPNCFWLFEPNFWASFCDNWAHWVFLFSLILSLVSGLFWQFGFYQSFSYQICNKIPKAMWIIYLISFYVFYVFFFLHIIYFGILK